MRLKPGVPCSSHVFFGAIARVQYFAGGHGNQSVSQSSAPARRIAARVAPFGPGQRNPALPDSACWSAAGLSSQESVLPIPLARRPSALDSTRVGATCCWSLAACVTACPTINCIQLHRRLHRDLRVISLHKPFAAALQDPRLRIGEAATRNLARADTVGRFWTCPILTISRSVCFPCVGRILGQTPSVAGRFQSQ